MVVPTWSLSVFIVQEHLRLIPRICITRLEVLMLIRAWMWMWAHIITGSCVKCCTGDRMLMLSGQSLGLLLGADTVSTCSLRNGRDITRFGLLVATSRAYRKPLFRRNIFNDLDHRALSHLITTLEFNTYPSRVGTLHHGIRSVLRVRRDGPNWATSRAVAARRPLIFLHRIELVIWAKVLHVVGVCRLICRLIIWLLDRHRAWFREGFSWLRLWLMENALLCSCDGGLLGLVRSIREPVVNR